jgi:hypothetical protein
MYWNIKTFFQSNLRLNEDVKLRLLKSYIKDLKNEQVKRG